MHQTVTEMSFIYCGKIPFMQQTHSYISQLQNFPMQKKFVS